MAINDNFSLLSIHFVWIEHTHSCLTNTVVKYLDRLTPILVISFFTFSPRCPHTDTRHSRFVSMEIPNMEPKNPPKRTTGLFLSLGTVSSQQLR